MRTHRFFLISFCFFSLYVSAAEKSANILEIALDENTLSLDLEETEPISCETYQDIIDQAKKERRTAFFIAFPYKDSSEENAGFNVVDGNYQMINSHKIPLFQNPCNRQLSPRIYTFFIDKDTNGKCSVDFTDSLDAFYSNYILGSKKMDRIWLHLLAHVPENHPVFKVKTSKIIKAQKRLAITWLKEKEFTKSLSLLQNIIDNPLAKKKLQQYASFVAGQLYINGDGCTQDLQKARSYLNACAVRRELSLHEKIFTPETEDYDTTDCITEKAFYFLEKIEKLEKSKKEPRHHTSCLNSLCSLFSH